MDEIAEITFSSTVKKPKESTRDAST